MRNALLLSLLAAVFAGAAPDVVAAQSQPVPAPKPATQQPPPAAPKPATPPAQAPAPKPAPPAAAAPAGGTTPPTTTPAPTPRRPPPAPAPVAPPPTAAAKSGPAGQPQQVSVPRVLEGDFVGKNPRRESILSCSGNTRTTMLQINQPMPERMYTDADVVYYVIGGEGTMNLDGKESKLALNDFVSIPRGGSHSFKRRGNRTLILLSVLGGEACDAPK